MLRTRSSDLVDLASFFVQLAGAAPGAAPGAGGQAEGG